MKPSKFILALLLAASAIVFWFLGRPPAAPVAPVPAPRETPRTAPPAAGPAPAGAAVPSGAAATTDGAVATPPDPAREAAPVADGAGTGAVETVEPLPAEKAVEVLRASVKSYGQRFRGNPVGSNAEITAALSGDNPGGVRFIDPAAGRVNERGELVDEWGTPFFFHQLSGTEMEIFSAGPDRKRGTSDDLVAR